MPAVPRPTLPDSIVALELTSMLAIGTILVQVIETGDVASSAGSLRSLRQAAGPAIIDTNINVLLMVAVFGFLTCPISGHMVAQAANPAVSRSGTSRSSMSAL